MIKDYGFFHDYPYTNFHEMNLDWLLAQMLELRSDMKNFVNQNTIKYADPIQWNITTQYEGNTVVIDPASGSAYLSTQPVPSGVNIINTDYWTEIGNFAAFYESIKESITAADDGDSPTATSTRSAGDLVWLNDILYVVLSDISAGNAYIFEGESANVEETNIETLLKEIKTDYTDQISAEVEARENADNVIMSSIAKMAGLGNQGLGFTQIDSPYKFDHAFEFFTDNSTYDNMQGGCYNPSRNCFVIGFIKGDESMAMLVETNASLTEVTRRQTFNNGELYHCNDMCYNPRTNKYYIAGYSSIETLKNCVVEINANDLSFSREITLPPITSPNDCCGHICYDNDNNVFYVVSNNDILKYDSSFNLISSSPYGYVDFANKENIYNDVTENYLQCVEYFNDKIVAGYSTLHRFVSWSGTLVFYNTDGSIFTTYSLDFPCAGSELEIVANYSDGLKVISGFVNGTFITDFKLQTYPYAGAGNSPVKQVAITVANDTDLNDLLTCGTYNISPLATGIAHSPFKEPYNLYVISGYTGFIQIAVKLAGATAIAIRRCGYEGTYTNWEYLPHIMSSGMTISMANKPVIGWVGTSKKDMAIMVEAGIADRITKTDISVNGFGFYLGTAEGNLTVSSTNYNCSVSEIRGSYVQLAISKKDNSDITITGGICVTGLATTGKLVIA